VVADQFAFVLKSVPVFPQSLRASTGVAEGIGAGVGDFLPVTDAVGEAVALGDAVAEGAGLADGAGLEDGEGFAVGVGEGLGALSALLALAKSARQKNPTMRRGEVIFFIPKITPGGKAHDTVF
jgi:hypothetical protein